MKERIISGVILAAAIIGLGLIGSYPLSMALMLCSVIGYYELTSILCSSASSKKKKAVEEKKKGFDLIAWPGLVLSVVYYGGLMFIEWRYGLVNTPGMVSASDFWTLLILSLDFLLTMGIYVFTFPRRKSSNATGAVAAFLYVPVMMSFLLRTRSLSHGIWLYLLIFICSSVSDVCALAVGMAIGRHKLAPVLSPKKTIEGALGGIAGSALVSCLIAVLIRRFEPGINAVPVFLIIGICGSIIGQTGDLAASAIKRNHGIKDYGHLIPGHGGIMDRFDSVIFTAPVIYYLSFLLMARI
ncbi:MAG: phosphatidate cytidylyltransferase [Lachnospiraceae bacterium]|nr:phosphatidate cytidylyltransferase [Lachnospiraceae bacterium]